MEENEQIGSDRLNATSHMRFVGMILQVANWRYIAFEASGLRRETLAKTVPDAIQSILVTCLLTYDESQFLYRCLLMRQTFS